MTATVTTIIPAYRASGTIGRAIDSLLGQTRPPDEILVVDDGSPDDVAPALAPYGDRVTLLRKPNGGAASARNFGIDHARGDFIAFLDADDHWAPDKLELQLAMFERHPEVGFCASRFWSQHPNEVPVPFELPDRLVDRVLRPMGVEAFDVAMLIWTSVVIVRREVLGELRFPTQLRTAEDRYLWIRLARTAPLYILGAPLATAVLEPGSLTRSNVEADCRDMLRLIHGHQDLLGPRGTRRQEALLYRRLAGSLLNADKPRAALVPAARRLVRDPFALEGWWILFKSARRAVT